MEAPKRAREDHKRERVQRFGKFLDRWFWFRKPVGIGPLLAFENGRFWSAFQTENCQNGSRRRFAAANRPYDKSRFPSSGPISVIFGGEDNEIAI